MSPDLMHGFSVLPYQITQHDLAQQTWLAGHVSAPYSSIKLLHPHHFMLFGNLGVLNLRGFLVLW